MKDLKQQFNDFPNYIAEVIDGNLYVWDLENITGVKPGLRALTFFKGVFRTVNSGYAYLYPGY